MIKAIFFDIDGTLVSFETHQIPSTTIEVLKQLKKQGIKIFVATGRGKDGLGVLEDISFDGYITLNGQYCYVGDRVIYENVISKEDLETLLFYVTSNNIPCGFTEEHDKYYNFRDWRVDEIHSITNNDNQPAKDCSNVVNQRIYQCQCFISEQEEHELLSQMPNCISARWHPLFCDISPKGGTKQNGIDKFLEYYGLNLEDTMAFGDGGNDIPMLRHVNVAVAMGNSNNEVKNVADYVTDTVDHDGVVKALKYFKLI